MRRKNILQDRTESIIMIKSIVLIEYSYLLIIFRREVFRGEVQALKELKRVERFGVRGKRKWS